MAIQIDPSINIQGALNIVAPAVISAVANSVAPVSAKVGAAITSLYPFATVSAGVTPYTFYVQSGTLPTGITLDPATGLVSGTPTVTQSAADVVFAVRDNDGVSAATTVTVNFTVTQIVSTAGAVTTRSLIRKVNMSVFYPFSAVSGGTTPYTYFVSSGTLPAGISINSTNGLVSGNPTATYSTADVTFSVKDANNIVSATTSTVSFTVAANTYSVYYTIVAGGGGGGRTATLAGGGGGAGGYLTTGIPIVPGQLSGGSPGALQSAINFIGETTYTIGVGGGGSAETQGGNSYITGGSLANIVAVGGGYAGSGFTFNPGGPGGSGGGGYNNIGGLAIGSPGPGVGGTQGFPGVYGGGGAGGAGTPTVGGAGRVSSILGPTQSKTFAVGGNGASAPAVTASAGTGNGGSYPTGSGGSGNVILAMPTPSFAGPTSYSPAPAVRVVINGSFTVLVYTSSGTYTA